LKAIKLALEMEAGQAKPPALALILLNKKVNHRFFI